MNNVYVKLHSTLLIGSRNLEYPWIFTVLRTERKMARRFAKVSEEEIVAINEAAFFLSIWFGKY